MDWIQLLNTYNITYVTRGKNTKRGEISVKCPWCSDEDPSEHLGISLDRENWGCLRNGTHRGKKPHRLVQALLGCSNAQASLIVGQQSVTDPSTLGEALAALNATSEALSADTGHEVLEHLPPEFQPIRPDNSTKRFWRYLEKRGFTPVQKVIDKYDLRCCQTGRYKERIIMPLYDHAGDLLCWTSRAIVTPAETPRYLASSQVVKSTMFNEDRLYEGGDLLFIVEGPFDAMKLDYYSPKGVRATCGFGVTWTTDQICILHKLIKRFRKIVVMFDYDAAGQAFDAADWLQFPNVSIAQLPDGIGDPGEMNAKQIKRLVASVLN